MTDAERLRKAAAVIDHMPGGAALLLAVAAPYEDTILGRCDRAFVIEAAALAWADDILWGY